MCKKFLVFVIVLITSVSFVGCKESETSPDQPEQIWLGQYVRTNEQTGEIKIATVKSEDFTSVTISFKSVRSTDEFCGKFATSSGKYAVIQNEERCLNFKLQSNNTIIAVDDIWMNADKPRNENWSGKYKKIYEDDIIPEFGDKSWNGEYENIDTAMEISLYSILKDTVLITYADPFTKSKNGKSNIVCSGSGNECIYDLDGRTVKIVLDTNKHTVTIDDCNTVETEEGWLNLSGTYKLK